MAELTEDEQWALNYPATAKWWKTHDSASRGDQPRVSVWYPQQGPFARLETSTRGGPGQTWEELPERGPVHAHLTLAGIDIGGPLDDLVLLIAAATESLSDMVAYAEALKVEALERAKAAEERERADVPTDA